MLDKTGTAGAGKSDAVGKWFSKAAVRRKGADDCLPSNDFSELRDSILGKSLSDDAAEIVSAALSVGQRIRSKNLYIEDALRRLKFIVGCALQDKPQLALARDEFLRMQLEVSQSSGLLGGSIARLSGGSPTVTVLFAILASTVIWGLCVAIVRGALSLKLFPKSGLLENVFFMDQRALLVVISAALLGGVVSIATRLGEFARMRGLDPFAMFWTALLKPLIGVTLAVFIFASLSGEIVGLGFLGKDPLGLGGPDGKSPLSIEATGTLTAKAAYILWVIGFLAGFSERFAGDFVQRTEGLASGGVGDNKKTS